MSERNSALFSILGKMWTKYNILNTILPNYSEITDELILYVDMRSILGILYSDRYDFNMILNDKEKLMISAELLNMIGHYRNYFWSRENIQTTFVFIYSDKVSSRNLKLDPNYNKNFLEKRSLNSPFEKVHKIITKNIELLKILIPKIPNVYFIDCNEIEPECIPLLLTQKNEISIIMTNNLTYNRYLEYKDFNILTLKSNESKIIRNYDLINKPKFKEKYLHPFISMAAKTKASEDLELMNTPIKMINWILSISGSEKHNIIGIPKYGLIKTLKFLHKNNIINKYSFSKEEMKSCLNNLLEDNLLEKILINYNIFNLKSNINDLSLSELNFIENQLINSIDNNSLQKVNERYFNNSIKLGYLFQGY